jgi:HlyD family secretion protein
LNRSIFWLISAVALLAIGAWWQIRSPAGTAPRYRTATVERGALDVTVSATGTVQPVAQVEVGSQVGGTVAQLFADYNARVRAGQVLCQLERSAFRARMLQAEAAVARAEAEVKNSEWALKRAQDLRQQNVTSEIDPEAAEVTRDRRSADLQSARAALEVARVDLEHTTIRSPIDGVVIARSIELGQTVAASPQAPRLFVIANDLERMQVETHIAEADIGRVHPGLPASFRVDAYPGVTFHGEVAQVRLEPIVEQGVVTYAIVVAAANPDQELRPGMTAAVTVRVEHRDDALKVPNAALRFHPAGKWRGGADVAVRPGAGLALRTGAADHGSSGWANAPLGANGAATGAATAMKAGTVFVLRQGRPVPVPVATGITDGTVTEVVAADLGADDAVIVGLEIAVAGPSLQPPPRRRPRSRRRAQSRAGVRDVRRR